jgi:hypothetical protein
MGTLTALKVKNAKPGDKLGDGDGLRLGGGTWSVSKVALAMFLDGDAKALRAYHAGDRSSEMVAPYFERMFHQIRNGL